VRPVSLVPLPKAPPHFGQPPGNSPTHLSSPLEPTFIFTGPVTPHFQLIPLNLHHPLSSLSSGFFSFSDFLFPRIEPRMIPIHQFLRAPHLKSLVAIDSTAFFSINKSLLQAFLVVSVLRSQPTGCDVSRTAPRPLMLFLSCTLPLGE